MERSYGGLIEKVDAFTRKYYWNKIIRGGIYFLAITLGTFLAVTILEYFGRFSSGVRMTLFFAFLVVSAVLLVRFIVIPALKIFKLGKMISREEAAKMIGSHFPNISDKLINTLQLQNQLSGSDSALLQASIDQKIVELQPIPFSAAINFGENKRYIPYVLPSLILGALLLLISPKVITEGAERIVSYNREFTPEAPFSFILLNESLKVPLNEDIQIQVETSGEYAPSEMNLLMDGKPFRMKQSKKGVFSYTFKNVRNSLPFAFSADGFESTLYQLEVLPTPSITNFEVSLAYPPYLNKKNEILVNTGNLQIPEGTTVNWIFFTENTEEIFAGFADTSLTILPGSDKDFSYTKRVYSNEAYRVAAINSIVGGKDTIDYRISVLKDGYPKVEVDATADSTDNRKIYFGGLITDDYGLQRLEFHYAISSAEGEQKKKKESIPIGKNTTQEFYYFKDFSDLELSPGDKVEYYFMVWDNDGVNGSKSAKSVSETFKAPTKEELEENRKQTSENVKEQLEKSIEKAAELQKELNELNKDLLEKSEMSWQDKKRIEDILQKQKDLEQDLNKMEQQRAESQSMQENYEKQNENILKKQELLEKMFNELMSEEMKELYRKLEELMSQLDQEQIREELEKMELSSEDLEKELDRTLEIFKQMEFEQEFEKTLEKLEELSKKQEELSEKTANKEDTPEKLKEEQEKLNEEFDEIKEDLKSLEEKNNELERPNEMPDTSEQEEAIEKEMSEASEQLDEKKNKKASESQQNAADQMQEMAQQMEASMQSQQSQSMQEDMEDLRALLENIIQLSFDQEAIMEELKQVERDDPKYVLLGQRQKKLEDDSQMVEDSLFALSKRIAQLESTVNEEIGAINKNISKAIEDIGERMTSNATTRQQYVMTSYNNLALLLDESLQQMQMAMANEMPGQGNCEKPGGKGSKPSEGKMSKMQEEMGKKLEQMKKALEQNKMPGGKKPGQGGQGMSKEIAQMAAEQAAIRREIEKMAQELNEQGKGEGKGLEDLAKQMEENEKDLVNQEITQETLRRQEDILTRLLESEKAEREREYDNKRESNAAGEYERSNPEKYLEYNRKKAREVELLRTMPPDLKPYYKDRVNDYFLNFEN
jgi:hypothetical protein